VLSKRHGESLVTVSKARDGELPAGGGLEQGDVGWAIGAGRDCGGRIGLPLWGRHRTAGSSRGGVLDGGEGLQIGLVAVLGDLGTTVQVGAPLAPGSPLLGDLERQADSVRPDGDDHGEARADDPKPVSHPLIVLRTLLCRTSTRLPSGRAHRPLHHLRISRRRCFDRLFSSSWFVS
jgi:hypothetical protein